MAVEGWEVGFVDGEISGELHVDGDYILVDVRCEEENELRRGSLVLLYEHDVANDLFLVVAHRES